ncbi:MAG TPA: hypothetical protein VFY71_09730 [Planctomycetota bacterium]|nr:hypothetical protein [Planctomycetota bacterium]
MTDDDYLWDRSGEPDRTVSALESELARHRWSGRLPQAPLPVRASRRAWRPLSLAAGLAAVALGAWLLRDALSGPAPAPLADGPVYRAEALSGALTASEFRAGERLVTDADTRARVEIGDVGSLILEPDSALRVERPSPALAADAGHLLWLEHGALTASIFAAPRLFQLGTPSGLAVDLGCVYSARVEDDGVTLLSVITGQVAFETPERRVTVPHGASTRAVPGRGPDTPTWDGAPIDWRQAVAHLDEAVADGAPVDTPLAAVLSTDRAADSLTLWHLLAWSALPRPAREAVADRLAALAPAPAAAPRGACLELDTAALDAWRATLGWSW